MRFAICLVFAIGCGSDDPGTSTGIDINTLECPPNSTLTYTNFGQQVIQDRCLMCHAGQSDPMLTSLDSVVANKQDILETTVGTREMPEDKNIPLEERRMIGEWLACGAPP
jgi:uncharacterized membrane protein